MHTKYSIKCQKEENARNTRIYRGSAIAYIPIEALHKNFNSLCQEMNYKLKDLPMVLNLGRKHSSLTPQPNPSLHLLTPRIVNRESLLNLTHKLERRRRERKHHGNLERKAENYK